MIFDPILMVIAIAFMVIGIIASNRLKARFREYSLSQISSGFSGKEVAEKMLRDSGIYDVQVISVEGKLTDHYNPANKTVNLSHDVYNGKHVASAAVAAHECGHAVQHATAYTWLNMRSKLVPMVNFSSKMMNFVIIGMMLFAFTAHLYNQALLVIIALQSAIVLFSMITLPVELDASKRALVWLGGAGITKGQEHQKATNALRWAASTYVIAALAAITTLIYFIMQYNSRK